MRVALNAQLLSTEATYRGAGISRAIYELLRHLPDVGASLEYLVYAPDSTENRRLLRNPLMSPRLSNLPMERPSVRVPWEQLVLPVELWRARADLLHALGFVSPLAWGGPTVVTVYDLSFVRFPWLFNRGNRLYLRTMTPLSLRRADRVITISEFTRQDVIRLCGVSPSRVRAIHLAADDRFRPADESSVAQFRQEHGLPDRFILYLGTLEPRKNLTTLVRAYAELRRTGRTEHTLVLAGARGWQYEPIYALVRELGLEEAVQFPGYVPADEQALWYTAADIFAYPSLFEGFGLQILEAMACGTPVVASNSSSLPEVVGEAGLMVDPADVGGLAAAIGRLVDDDTLRARLREAGLKRAATFSWRRMAEETVAVYHEVLRSR